MVTVKRTWKERLLSWPWKPWEALKIIENIVPLKGVLLAGTDKIYMRSEILKEIMNNLKK